MYITLFIVIFMTGLLLLFLPSDVYKKWIEGRVFSIVMRMAGIVLCIVSAIFIYAVLSGKIVLPLIK